MQVIDLKYSGYVFKVLPEGIFNLGLSFYLCQKRGNFLPFFKTLFSRFFKMKLGLTLVIKKVIRV